MKYWYAIFEDDPSKQICIEAGSNGAELLSRFDVAEKSGEIDARKVIGMWVIDDATKRKEVIRRHGDRIPADIRIRSQLFEIRKRRRQSR